MQSIESEGDTIDQAIDNALQVLRVSRDRVEIEILSDATRGLFGFGGKPARVRAMVRAPLAALPSGETAPVVPWETTNEKSISAPVRSSREQIAKPAHVPERVPAGPPPEAVIEKSRRALEQLLGHLGVSGHVETARSSDSERITLAVTGDNSGLLIGRRGQTLDAIEHVINRIAGRADDGAPSRIAIDVERYRERRQEYLDALARRLADKAKNTGRAITLNPMNPRDRRIVHLALQSDPGIETRSQGEGQFRKILILPVDQPHAGSRPNRANRPLD